MSDQPSERATRTGMAWFGLSTLDEQPPHMAMRVAMAAEIIDKHFPGYDALLAACGRATRHLGPLDSGTVSGLRTPLDELKAALAAAGVEVG